MSPRLAAALVAALLTTGCIQSGTLITVKPDGSGTLDQSVLMNTSGLQGMLGGLGGQQPGQGQGAPGPSEDDFKRTAGQLGEGVTFVSSERIKTPDGFEGAKARFAFKDITKLKVQQDPQMPGGPGGLAMAQKPDSPVTFSLDRTGGVSTLTVTFNDKAKASSTLGSPQGGPDMDNPQMMEMMKAMFKGFKVGIDLEVAGTIVKTNADHVQGSRVTLLEMDLGGLLENEAKLKEIQKAVGPNASLSELKPYLKDVKGLKLNDPVVTVAFK